MPRRSPSSALTALLLAGCLLPVDGSFAQLARPPLVASAQSSASSEEPSFRDPKTGQVWTPGNVSQDGKPLDPLDRAFDPGGQAVVSGRPVVQSARVAHVGMVPILAGPTVPFVEIDNETLTVRPGRKWRVTLYLQNNSGSTFAPELSCWFSNGTKTVMETEVLVPPTGPGQRVGLFFVGPPSEDYVDLVTCRVVSP